MVALFVSGQFDRPGLTQNGPTSNSVRLALFGLVSCMHYAAHVAPQCSLDLTGGLVRHTRPGLKATTPLPKNTKLTTQMVLLSIINDGMSL